MPLPLFLLFSHFVAFLQGSVVVAVLAGLLPKDDGTWLLLALPVAVFISACFVSPSQRSR